MISFKEGQPIIIGLAGKAGSGKTSVAEKIIPKGSIETAHHGIKWDHIFYALPLYELASIKKNIIGYNEASRKMHAIHEVLYEVYGGSAIGNMPHYETFAGKVKQIYDMAIESEGIKPRKFLQLAGDICREHDSECFSSWAIIKSNKMYRQYIRSLEDQDNNVPFCVIISDVRYLNEANSILKQPNGFVIVFDADNKTLEERLLKRDGKLMDQKESLHSSEQGMDLIKQIASIVIDTNNLTLEEQVEATLSSLGVGSGINA